jgi:hypothetical protein
VFGKPFINITCFIPIVPRLAEDEKVVPKKDIGSLESVEGKVEVAEESFTPEEIAKSNEELKNFKPVEEPETVEDAVEETDNAEPEEETSEESPVESDEPETEETSATPEDVPEEVSNVEGLKEIKPVEKKRNWKG